jgi:uncharacterized protein YjbI with pentapeptide repeats
VIGRFLRLTLQRLTRFRWTLIGLAALVVVLACILALPQMLVDWELGAQAGRLTATDRAKAINDVRATLLQGLAGAAILLGAYFTYRQLQIGREQLESGREQLRIAQQGQVTERFTRAIDQLGHAELDVRLGGIYALERIANDSSDDRATIAEILTAFVRGHAPWPPRMPGQYVADAAIERVPELQVRAPDVQAALTVLARRQLPPRPSGRLDLHATDLRKASLASANLQRANLVLANLAEADLDDANLQKASLNEVNLQRATLASANLEEANLEGAILQGARLVAATLRGTNLVAADLQGARLASADLQGARLTSAHLQEANLFGANLQKANLFGTNFQGASLDGAILQGAHLDDANLQRASLFGAVLQGATLDRSKFEHAHADSTTIWPKGFDPGHVGVALIDGLTDAAKDSDS